MKANRIRVGKGVGAGEQTFSSYLAEPRKALVQPIVPRVRKNIHRPCQVDGMLQKVGSELITFGEPSWATVMLTGVASFCTSLREGGDFAFIGSKLNFYVP